VVMSFSDGGALPGQITRDLLLVPHARIQP
jgi:hypothetical protein